MDDIKKKRAPNFTSHEKSLLVEIVRKYSAVVECKTTNNVSRTEKNEAWSRLADEYNSTSGCEFRTADNLRGAWDNLKKAARRTANQVKKEFNRTGGGSSRAPPLTSVDEAVLSVIGVSATGLENEFDGDADDVFDVATEVPATPPVRPRFEAVASQEVNKDQNVGLLYELEEGTVSPVNGCILESTLIKEPRRIETPATDEEEEKEDSRDVALGNSPKRRDVVPRMLYQRENPALKRASLTKNTSTLAEDEEMAKVLKRRTSTMSLSDELLAEKIRLTKAMRVGQEIENEKKKVELELLQIELRKKKREYGIVNGEKEGLDEEES
uniref:Regulatory protein zeste n=1 Tax=Lygus hesperus TaxID=30085 RepID=A0A146LYD6_LYGHE